jgi:hypothetical protein
MSIYIETVTRIEMKMSMFSFVVLIVSTLFTINLITFQYFGNFWYIINCHKVYY